MGGIIDSIFGGGSKKATKKGMAFEQNVYNTNQAEAAPFTAGATGDYNTYNQMLTGTDPAAYNNWLNSSDYATTTKAGNDAINQNMATQGLLHSGSTLKAVTQFGQQNVQQYRNNYMNQLLGGAQLGAGVTTAAMGNGVQSASNYAGTAQQGAQLAANGMGNFLNFGLGVASMVSDRRLKTDIKRVGTTDKKSGKLPVYTYRYKGDDSGRTHMGVMAQEVAKKRPDALGPRFGGNFMTVNYGELAHA